MQILKTMKKVPGGMIVVPLILGALINTFLPNALKIGGFTTALFKNGSPCLIALFILCSSAKINIHKLGTPIYKGLILTVPKILIGGILGWFIGREFGLSGILGLSPLAIIPAVANSNGGMYGAMAAQYGNDTDEGAISLVALNVGPFVTMLFMGVGGLADFPIYSFIAILVPVAVGIFLGNADENMREFLAGGSGLLIPFFGFALGSGINLTNVINAGISGILLGLFTFVVTGFVTYALYGIFTGSNRALGFGVANTAGTSMVVPGLVAEVDKSLLPYAAVATTQIAASVIVCAILCPLMVGYLDKKWRQNQAKYDRNEIIPNKQV
ncbi:2-keto-3-deoxygluconate permease [Clostridium luticellarii]|uniref:2-keto-3-deoxygluconate permease n=1 Tax=Clostridium luticellarii TaxID=1691940 RepID=UPI002356BE1B|nr:2-keto-3-deoxygluconate permease [Clostridium luticellarii]MCI1945212.1 2-keto-3-deoxygluconate permease [Clostridium luticellarii]MCI1969694.1 2-keto-3-deoxygluconate permease [Clostridium luticellarii]